MKNGDEEAFTLIYQRYVLGISSFARNMGIPAHSAEDVAQNVFLTLIKSVGTFDVRRGSAGAFIYGITRNHVLRWIRENRNNTSISDSELSEIQVENPLMEYSKAEEILKLRKAIHQLPENYREVLILCEINELSYEEASEILVCAIGTVRSRLHRARSILARALRGTEENNGVRNYELSTLETNSL
jgi:RNA polymerase sigma-70 factor (ECF subfamily)